MRLHLAMVLAIAATLSLVAGRSPAQEEATTVANANFESTSEDVPKAWGWWSRTGVGSGRYIGDAGHDAPGAARITHNGPRDFAFSSETRIPVTPGQSLKAIAWVKPIRGNVELAIVGLSGKELIDWRIGRGGTTDTNRGEWTKLAARAIVPDNCDTIYVRFTGDGDVEALIDDVAFEPWDWTERDKPSVQGFAKERVVEKLNRGLVLRYLGDGQVYLSWRLLASDPDDIAFNVYRDDEPSGAQLMNRSPIRKTTDFTTDLGGDSLAMKYSWSVRPIAHGNEQAGFEPILIRESNTINDHSLRPLMCEDGGFQKVGLADLNGDGSFDFVAKRPGSNIDPYDQYWHASPGTIKLDACLSSGESLWTYDLGWSIEQGIWYSPYLVYDFDGDGKAEVVAKTGIGDPREEDGRVRTGEEFVTVLNGMTGNPVCQTAWPSREGFDGERGYNYSSRNQLGVAYLDGKTPCLIVARGTYNVMKVVAYQLFQGELQELWRWDNTDMPGNCWGQGAHWMHAADVDRDGRDELILGSVVLDDNGALLWSTGLGHPDHSYVGDIDPTRPGLEIYYGIESRNLKNSICLVDAATGEIIWGHDQPTTHIHSTGLCADIDAAHPGAECYSGERDVAEDRWLRSAQGDVIESPGDLGGLAPRSVYWDGDLQRELIRGDRIVGYPAGDTCGRIEGRVIQVADILGDWREEVITCVDDELRIYMTTIPAVDRRPCLMQDPIYRIDTAHGAMGYTQVPMVGYDIVNEAND